MAVIQCDVRRIRRNIAANMDVFTFDTTFEKLDNQTTEMLAQWRGMANAA